MLVFTTSFEQYTKQQTIIITYEIQQNNPRETASEIRISVGDDAFAKSRTEAFKLSVNSEGRNSDSDHTGTGHEGCLRWTRRGTFQKLSDDGPLGQRKAVARA